VPGAFRAVRSLALIPRKIPHFYQMMIIHEEFNTLIKKHPIYGNLSVRAEGFRKNRKAKNSIFAFF
jgi:hypothetical protein